MNNWIARRVECAQSRQAARLVLLLLGVVLPWGLLAWGWLS